jgi:phage major head subunit gpT-like protein
MLITQANLKAAFTGFNTRFNQALKNPKKVWSNQLVRMVPSDTETETHMWSDVAPRMREWVGERHIKNLVSRSFTLENKTFENSIAVPKEKFEDDKYGIFAGSKIDALAQRAAKWPDELVAPLMLNGASNLTYDGQGFFSANHPIDPDDASKGVQSNYYSSGKALTPANFDAVRAAMMNLIDSDGQVIGIMPDTLIVPPQLEGTARRIVEGENIVQGNSNTNESNVYKGMAKVLVIPEISSQPTAWYLAQLDVEADRPFIFQQRKAPVFVAQDKDDSEPVFNRREIVYGGEARGNAAAVLWHTIAKAVA